MPAPWCGHCKKLAPLFAQAAKQLAADDIPLGSVDCIAEEELYWRNSIRGYPTLLAFLAGEAMPYDGPREVDSVVAFMRAMRARVLVPLATAADLVALERRHRSVTQPLVLVLAGGAEGETGTGTEEEAAAVCLRAERALDVVCRRLGAFTCGVFRGGGGGGDSTSNRGGGGGTAAAAAMTRLGVPRPLPPSPSLPGVLVLPTLGQEQQGGEQGGRPVFLPATRASGESLSLSLTHSL